MILNELQISNLRNIQHARLSLHPNLNIISGLNGGGKTTFLEALYLLSTGHSFRTREVVSLISQGQEALTVFAKTNDDQRISIQKSLHFPTMAKLNGEACTSSSELASFLPSQIFYQDIFQLIDAGPGVRRTVLDWGLFHVEHNYLSLWKDYRRALKQRNSLLKQRARAQLFVPWNQLMAELAIQLDKMREHYVSHLIHEFNAIVSVLSDLDCSLQYFKGWDKKGEGRDLSDILTASYDKDMNRHYGPHQADLIIVSNEYKVKQYLSRGQQKIILFALKFAQSRLVSKSCLYLIDDLCSELDTDHISRLLDYITNLKGQFFITTKLKEEILSHLKPNTYSLTQLRKGQIEVSV
jgi:DNA replication and repair protein RecF